MRSPMTTASARPSVSSTASWALVTVKADGGVRGAGVRPATRAASAAVKAGFVPQQPPTTLAPASTMRSMTAANSAGSTSYTVRPSTMCGSPAFGRTTTGQREQRTSSRATGSSSAGPSEQFTPTTCAPSDDSTAAATPGGVPRNVRPSSPNVMEAKMGRLEKSFAASTAAFASRRSVMVSMSTMSHPASTTARTCSANIS